MPLINLLPKAFCSLTGKADAKRLAQQQPTPGIREYRDLTYLPDGARGHLLDVYVPEGTREKLPLVIDIHGGGLMYAYKELNKYYNLAIASRGYTVISISYRLAPEVRFPDQVRDVLAAFRWIAAHAEEYPCRLDETLLTGDSAGALLAAYCDLVNRNETLQAVYKTEGTPLRFAALGLVSGMFYTTRGDWIGKLRPLFFGPKPTRADCYPYMDWEKLLAMTPLTPCYLVTSEEDMLKKHTLLFDETLTKHEVPHQLHHYPKGEGKKLEHVFSIAYPQWAESREAIDEMLVFFRGCVEECQETVRE